MSGSYGGVIKAQYGIDIGFDDTMGWWLVVSQMDSRVSVSFHCWWRRWAAAGNGVGFIPEYEISSEPVTSSTFQ